jgi:endonuclease/exonuclease/phosphatase family metal-dependent hydrolase
VSAGLALTIGAWLLGRIASDRATWSQWLLWMPTPAAVLAAALGCANALRPAARAGVRRRRLIRWGVTLALLVLDFALLEHRFLRRADPHPSGVRLVHWNLTERLVGVPDPLARRVIDLDADLTVLTGAGASVWTGAVRDWLGADHAPRTLGPFTVLSRLPLVRSRIIVAADDIFVALVEVDAGRVLGRTLVLHLYDLPSNPRRSRMADARRARGYLDRIGTAPPDVALGDFNITRGSAALRHLLPGMRHAFNEAGHGYGASFPGDRPWYHIDHMLLGPSVRATRYDLVPAPNARHRAQVVWLDVAR